MVRLLTYITAGAMTQSALNSGVTYKIYFKQFNSSNGHFMTYMYSTRSGHKAFCFQKVYYKYDTNKSYIMFFLFIFLQ